MLKMKAHETLIQQHINQGTGKSSTSKDIQNIVETRDGGLTEIIEEMKRLSGKLLSVLKYEKHALLAT